MTVACMSGFSLFIAFYPISAIIEGVESSLRTVARPKTQKAP